MSDKKIQPTGYSAAKEPRLTASQFQDMGYFFTKLVESPLKWWIIAAGIGAIIEGLHVLWLALRYVARF